MSFEDTGWFTYGVVLKLSIDNLMEMREFLKKKNVQIIYDKVSPYKIRLIEVKPSGGEYYGEE